MPAGVRTLFAALAVCACSGAGGRVVNGDLGPGPQLPSPAGFSLTCVYMPPANEEQPPPPSAVVTLCAATEGQEIQVVRIEDGMRIRLRFPDTQGRSLELYVYERGTRYERGARVVARRRGAEPEVFEPESGWLAIDYFDRRKKAIALHYSLRYPGLVVNGSFREGDVPRLVTPPPRRRPDVWGMSDGGPTPR